MPEESPARRDAAIDLTARRRIVDDSAAVAARTIRGPRPAHRQNGVGDVVVPVADGEIVALPRLWDFDLAELSDDAGVLRSDTGLIAVITLAGDTAVVTDVTDSGLRRRSA